MEVATRRWFDDFDHSVARRHRDSWWGQDSWLDDWHDWPRDWPNPREIMQKFWRDTDSWWKDWPEDWPRMNAVMPRFTEHLDQLDRNWRNDPFWMDIYPRWAEPIFKEGIDVQSSILNDGSRFAVDIDAYQFKPEEIQVKTLDDTLMIEGRHEDIKDRDNFTKMYFVRKYQLPRDVDIGAIQSSIDARGRLTVEAPKFNNAITGRERVIPIEGPSGRRTPSASPRGRHDSGYSNGYRSDGYRSRDSPLHVETSDRDRGREIRVDTSYGNGRDSRPEYRDMPSKDGYSTHSYSYHRSESRTRLSPHEVPIQHETRPYQDPTHPPYSSSDRRASFDTRREASDYPPEQRSPGRGVFDSIRDKFEKGFRSQSRGAESRDYRDEPSRMSSRHDYRVDSPVSTTSGGGILRNGGATNGRDAGKAEEMHQSSMRSVHISRKY